MSDQGVFAIDIEVRHYELDTQGHVNSANYLLYAEHARWRHLESLGIGLERGSLAGFSSEAGYGPICLPENVFANVRMITPMWPTTSRKLAGRTSCLDGSVGPR